MMKYLLSPRGSFTIIFSLIIAMSSPTLIMGLYNNNTLFNRAGFIMTHNSATGEDPSGISGCNNQGSDNMVAQLNCGARAFDYRPRRLSNGDIKAHHNSFCPVDVLMSTSVQSVITWLTSNPTELVILYVSHFQGSGEQTDISNGAADVLSSLNVDTIRNNECGQLAGLTIGQIKARSQLSSGGYLLAVFGEEGGGGCIMDEQYNGGVTVDNGIDNFDNYMREATNYPSGIYASSGKLYMTQAFWQGAGNHVDLEANNPSGGGLNSYTATNVINGAYNFVNFLEVNNVCNNGLVLKSAIDSYFNSTPVLSNILETEQQLSVGEYIQSNNGMYQARLNTDGRFCIYDVADSEGNPIIPKVEVWCTLDVAPVETGGVGIIKMQADGNLVLYTPTNSFYWASNSNSGGALAYLILQDNRNLVVYQDDGASLWSCATNGDNSCDVEQSLSNCLKKDEQLMVDEYIQSNNGMYQARLNTDGNFCIYDVADEAGDPIPEVKGWCTPGGIGAPAGEEAGVIAMQGDGNLVLYTSTNSAYWASATGGANNYVVLQNDRHLVVYKGDGSYGGWACSIENNNSCIYIILEPQDNDNTCRYAASTTTPTKSPVTPAPSATTTTDPTTDPITASKGPSDLPSKSPVTNVPTSNPSKLPSDLPSNSPVTNVPTSNPTSTPISLTGVCSDSSGSCSDASDCDCGIPFRHLQQAACNTFEKKNWCPSSCVWVNGNNGGCTDPTTANPTPLPVSPPSLSPTKNPTMSPTEQPTLSPSVSPTKAPTLSPSVSPVTDGPTQMVCKCILPTPEPTKSPTDAPVTPSPVTPSPSKSPTDAPVTTSPVTPLPSKSPTDAPVTPAPVLAPAGTCSGSGASCNVGGDCPDKACSKSKNACIDDNECSGNGNKCKPQTCGI